MALYQEKYRFRDGRTNLGEKELNPRLFHIDGRIHALELLRVSWEAAVAEVQNHGLERINAVIQPVLDQAQAFIDQLGGDVEGAEQDWQAIETAWAGMDATISAIQASILNLAHLEGLAISDYGRSLIDDADASTARDTLAAAADADLGELEDVVGAGHDLSDGFHLPLTLENLAADPEGEELPPEGLYKLYVKGGVAYLIDSSGTATEVGMQSVLNQPPIYLSKSITFTASSSGTETTDVSAYNLGPNAVVLSTGHAGGSWYYGGSGINTSMTLELTSDQQTVTWNWENTQVSDATFGACGAVILDFR